MFSFAGIQRLYVMLVADPLYVMLVADPLNQMILFGF
jgi:hypothetical protein